MTILQFIPSLNIYDGGTTTYMQELAPELGKLVDLHVCALGKKEDCVKLENATVHTIELSLTRIRQMRRQWMDLLEDIKPDVVHINCCWMPHCALVQRWTRKSPQIVVFLTPHGMLEPWIIKRNYWTKKFPAILLYQKWAIKNADVIVATADEEKKHIFELGWNDNICMLPNGINCRKVEMKKHWNDAKQLLFMSRIHPKKGLEMLVETLAYVDGLFLKIAGDGEATYVDKLKHLVKKQNLQDRVKFVGPVYGENKWEMIREADVVVLPSYSENFGLIVAEALASGTPVLTTTGTPWNSIKQHQCGWWINPDVDELKRTIQEISRLKKDALEDIGRRARNLVMEKFDVTVLSKTLFAEYALMVGNS